MAIKLIGPDSDEWEGDYITRNDWDAFVDQFIGDPSTGPTYTDVSGGNDFGSIFESVATDTPTEGALEIYNPEGDFVGYVDRNTYDSIVSLYGGRVDVDVALYNQGYTVSPYNASDNGVTDEPVGPGGNTLEEWTANRDFIIDAVYGGTATEQQQAWFDRWVASGRPDSFEGMLSPEEYQAILDEQATEQPTDQPTDQPTGTVQTEDDYAASEGLTPLPGFAAGNYYEDGNGNTYAVTCGANGCVKTLVFGNDDPSIFDDALEGIKSIMDAIFGPDSIIQIPIPGFPVSIPGNIQWEDLIILAEDIAKTIGSTVEEVLDDIMGAIEGATAETVTVDNDGDGYDDRDTNGDGVLSDSELSTGTGGPTGSDGGPTDEVGASEEPDGVTFEANLWCASTWSDSNGVCYPVDDPRIPQDDIPPDDQPPEDEAPVPPVTVDPNEPEDEPPVPPVTVDPEEPEDEPPVPPVTVDPNEPQDEEPSQPGILPGGGLNEGDDGDEYWFPGTATGSGDDFIPGVSGDGFDDDEYYIPGFYGSNDGDTPGVDNGAWIVGLFPLLFGGDEPEPIEFEMMQYQGPDTSYGYQTPDYGTPQMSSLLDFGRPPSQPIQVGYNVQPRRPWPNPVQRERMRRGLL